MLFEDHVKAAGDRDINIIKRRPFPADELDPVDALPRRVIEIVGNHDLVSSFEQSKCCEGPNIPCATDVGLVDSHT